MKNIAGLALLFWMTGCSDEKFISTDVIAFTREGKIHVMNPDGSNVRLLRAEGYDMAWSSDGLMIAYSAENSIYTMEADGSEVKKMALEPTWSPQEPTWSPDGSSLAFTYLNFPSFCFPINHCYNIARIFIASSNGLGISPTNLVVDTLQQFQVVEMNPDWSPDGKRIVFCSSRARTLEIPNSWKPNLYIMNPDGTEVTRLTESFYEDANPVWSPDGKKIAFDRRGNANESWSIYVVNADGSDLFQVTHNLMHDRYYGHSPTWSPDGTRLAFVSDHDGNGEIYVINIDGTGLKRLTNDPGEDAYPAWSPGKIGAD
jgi:Tol biopolymer transport system component